MAKTALNTSLLRSRLKLKSIQSESLLKGHHPQAVALLESAGVKPGGIRNHATKLLASGAMATSLFLSSPQSLPIQALVPAANVSTSASPKELQSHLSQSLKKVLPPKIESLSPEQEAKISEYIHQLFGIHAYAQLEGNRLNHSYGLIGAEQHLPRYPGDTVYAHDEYQQAGITPGRGAWGYFARSKQDLTPDLIAKEKYYVAVQTLYLSDWETRLAYLRDWYKFRKVVVINPDNGKAVVAVIADSGPAAWTGKHFGGSPEVMAYLERKDGRQRGSVVLFFVDDPNDEIALGPLEANLESPLQLPSSH